MNISELYNRNYVPYSSKASAAVVQSRQGAWFPGVRIENISYPLTINAVQNALFCCMSEGHQPKKIFVEKSQQPDPVLSYWVKENELKIAELEVLDTICLYDVHQNLTHQQINKSLQKLLTSSLATYSNFPVSALIETGEGFITGINIETRDWSKGLCAERVALAKAISYGLNDFKALHISTLHGEYNSPCGACRQVILEHLPHQPVYLYYADGTRTLHYSSDLLPYSFQSPVLKQNDKK